LQLEAKSCEDPLKWWKVHEAQLPIVRYLVHQILGIVGSQIEVKRIFSIVGIMTRLRKCRLGTQNLNQLVLISKN
jgi:hypothetical protein